MGTTIASSSVRRPVGLQPTDSIGFAQEGPTRRHSGAMPQAASPEAIFQRPVFMGSGLPSLRSAPGMTVIVQSPLDPRGKPGPIFQLAERRKRGSRLSPGRRGYSHFLVL